jgi:hypothetical protein
MSKSFVRSLKYEHCDKGGNKLRMHVSVAVKIFVPSANYKNV